MKKIPIAATLAFCAMIAINALAQQSAQENSQVIRAYGTSRDRLTVTNDAPWTCRLVTVVPVEKSKRGVRSTTITDLAPGETLSASKKRMLEFNPFRLPSVKEDESSLNLQIPIIALYYRPEDGKNDYIGAAAGIFSISGGKAKSPSMSQMMLAEQDIRFADDVTPSAPKIQSVIGEENGVVPYLAVSGTSAQVFVWNSTNPAYITADGGDGGPLQLGMIKVYAGWPRITVTISAIDTDGTTKSWMRTFKNSEFYGTHAEIFILGMSDLH